MIPKSFYRSALIILLYFLLGTGSFVFSQTFSQVNKIVAADREAVDNFGTSVSISGNLAIVGSPREADDAAGANWMQYSGSAYIFQRNSAGNWVQVQKIVASDRGPGDLFGTSVSISGDYAIVGSYGDDENASGANYMFGSGSAYIFHRSSGGSWSQVQKIVANDRDALDYFGIAVSISGDRAVVGAYNDEDSSGAGNTQGAGSAYIFERDTTTNVWNQVKKIASGQTTDGNFGYAVSISGSSIIVGAYLENAGSSQGVLNDVGAAYFYERNSSGIWSQVIRVTASDKDAYDYFGYSVSISGSYAIVGAFQEADDATGSNPLSYAGSAYIFKKIGVSWFQVQKIVPSDRAAFDLFARSVSISGNFAVIGANSEDEDPAGLNTQIDAGSAYIFKLDSAGNWIQHQKIVASDRAANDYYGYASCISGSQIIIGAYSEDEDAQGANSLYGSGSAYLYEYCPLSTSSIHDTVCGSYTSPSGRYTWSTSGTYKDTILNALGCDSIITIHLTAPALPLQADSIIQKNPVCHNSNDGHLRINVNGGVNPYHFLWNTGDTLSTLNNLTAGVYSVQVSDAAGCSFTDTFHLIQPDSLYIQLTNVQLTSCKGGSDGQISISVNGGLPPYDIQWSNGDTSTSISNLRPDNYSVTVNDSAGCSTTLSYNLGSAGDSIKINPLRLENISCNGEADGAIEISVQGGVAPYIINWSNGEQGPSLSNLSPGTYTATIADSNGCELTSAFHLTEPDPIEVNTATKIEANCGKQNGILELEVKGGTTPYQVSWSNGGSGLQQSGLGPGEYAITVSDDNGCSTQYKASVEDSTGKHLFFANAFTPNDDGLNDVFKVVGNAECFTHVRFQIFNRWGEKLFETTRPFEEFWDGRMSGWPPKSDRYVYCFISDQYRVSGYLQIIL